MELDKAIKSRKSVKKFSKKKPDWRKIIEAIDSARYSPMAGNLCSLKFILVSDKEKIRQLSKASEQEFVADAQYAVVICSNPSITLNAYEERGGNYLKQQAGAGIQNFLLKLEEVGLATCWIGHFVDEKVKNILKIPKEINVEAFFPIGYEKETAKTKPKRKIELDRILYFEEYGKSRMGR
ncbi:nitroreductase family protein [Candidatus Pacearchaeota archaeon]|nr:nitroreductase family protein [Candidatus Pacearchaeota archaeon]MBI2057092.1 nitroreductase family protein [Candidatus Pacearchaeota archaeon]